MPKRYVHFDSIGYVIKVDGADSFRQGYKGDEVELTEAEAKRLDELGATGTKAPGPDPVTTPLGTPSILADDELAELSVPDLTAYLGQYPDEAQRVLDLEDTRDKGPRKGVVEHAERIIEANAAADNGGE